MPLPVPGGFSDNDIMGRKMNKYIIKIHFINNACDAEGNDTLHVEGYPHDIIIGKPLGAKNLV